MLLTHKFVKAARAHPISQGGIGPMDSHRFAARRLVALKQIGHADSIATQQGLLKAALLGTAGAARPNTIARLRADGPQNFMNNKMISVHLATPRLRG